MSSMVYLLYTHLSYSKMHTHILISLTFYYDQTNGFVLYKCPTALSCLFKTLGGEKVRYILSKQVTSNLF